MQVLAKIRTASIHMNPTQQWETACEVDFALEWYWSGDQNTKASYQMFYCTVPFRAVGNVWKPDEHVELEVQLVQGSDYFKLDTTVQLSSRGWLDVDGYWDEPYPESEAYHQASEELYVLRHVWPYEQTQDYDNTTLSEKRSLIRRLFGR